MRRRRPLVPTFAALLLLGGLVAACVQEADEDPLGSDRTLRKLAPDPALRARLPGIDEGAAGDVRVYLVDPNGFLMMRYPPGADVGGVRADIAKLLKLI